MFMTTTLAHYQLPVFGAGSSALLTQIGADQRSLLMRPLAPGAVQTDLPAAVTVQATGPTPEKLTPPMEFRQWLKVLAGYQAQAGMRGDPASHAADQKPESKG